VQRGIGQITPSRAVTAIARSLESRRLASWAFNQYLAIAPSSFVGSGAPAKSAHASRPAGVLAS